MISETLAQTLPYPKNVHKKSRNTSSAKASVRKGFRQKDLGNRNRKFRIHQVTADASIEEQSVKLLLNRQNAYLPQYLRQKKRGPEPSKFLYINKRLIFCKSSFFSNSCRLTCSFSKVKDSSSSYRTFLHYFNAIYKRRRDWKNSFHTNVSRHFTNRKSFSSSCSSSLNYNALKLLNSFFITFTYFV